MRPASYKSSLSLAMPVGTTRQKERRDKGDNVERQHQHVENPQSSVTGKSAQIEKGEQLRREKELAKIKEKYGDASARGAEQEK